MAYLACLAFCMLACLQGWSQIAFRTPGNDSVKLVFIQNSNSYRYEQKDSTELTYLVGNVKIKQGTTLIDCDSMILNPKQNYIESFGHVHINDNDSTNIYSDYMKYQVDQKTVYFQKAVKMTDGKGVLTTEELQYDLGTKIGTYEHGGKIVNNGSVLTSEQATYYEESKDVHFSKNVILRDPQYDLSADSLLYNTQTQISTFITETFIQFKDSTHRTVRTRDGYYDLRNRKAEFGKRPVITDGSQSITGESVHIDDSTGISTAMGHAIYKDTTQGVVMIADYMISDKKKNTFLATKKPVAIIKQDKDSLYISADTLFSESMIDAAADEKRNAIADSLHRIYVDSLEKASADSMHLRALQNRTPQDTLLAGADSSHERVLDRSDSLRPGEEDSLGKKQLDSLHRKEGIDQATYNRETDSAHRKESDTTGIPADSLHRKPLTAADSAKLKPLTARQQKKLEKEQVKAEKQKLLLLKEKQQTFADSVKEKKQDFADSVKKAAREARASARALKDSLAKAVKYQARAHADSVRKKAYYAKQAAKALADSLQQKAFNDSLMNTDSAKQAMREAAIKKRAQDSVSQIIQQRKADSIQRIRDSIEHPVYTSKDSSLRVIKAYHHVRIFSDSLQAVSDSLYYSGKDSIFRLFKDPVAWGSGHFQITGDTMFVYTKNKKANRMYVFENALAINKVGKVFYNQMKGTTINCYFKDGEVDYMRAKGNAESVYYVQDDYKAYTGVNKAHADMIDMVFAPKYDSAGKPQGRELYKVILRSDAEGSMIPMKKVNFDEMQLRGFKWQEALRPKSKQELFQ